MRNFNQTIILELRLKALEIVPDSEKAAKELFFVVVERKPLGENSGSTARVKVSRL